MNKTFLRRISIAVLAIAAVMALHAQSQSQPEAELRSTEQLDPAEAESCELEPALEVEMPGGALLEDLEWLDMQPAAICRMAPECDTNADCDAICGAGQGRCGRSRCPIRVCKCG